MPGIHMHTHRSSPQCFNWVLSRGRARGGRSSHTHVRCPRDVSNVHLLVYTYLCMYVYMAICVTFTCSTNIHACMYARMYVYVVCVMDTQVCSYHMRTCTQTKNHTNTRQASKKTRTHAYTMCQMCSMFIW
jgi:hypothetical protein